MISNDHNPTHQYLVCYKCGQMGHIKPNCPKLKGNVRVAAAHAEDILDETENMEDEEGTSGINQEDQQEVDHPSMTTQTACYDLVTSTPISDLWYIRPPLQDLIPSPPLVQPCTNMFPILRSDPTPHYVFPFMFPLGALLHITLLVVP